MGSVRQKSTCLNAQLAEGHGGLFYREKKVFSFLRYCGEKCQKADWESHWQWCQQKVESRSKKEMNRGQRIEEKCKTGHGRESGEEVAEVFEPFPKNSLAFELD